MKKHPELDKILTSIHASVLKRYGQNFLIDETIQRFIIQSAAIQKNDIVLEIGPGLGALTQHVPFEDIQYISYEIDRQYHLYLQQTFSVNTTHYGQNFLKAASEHVDVILGNLPYYITTDLLEKVMKDFSSAQRGVFLIQKEVVARLLAQPGDDAYGPLAVLMQFLGTIEVLMDVPPDRFYPEPHVTSTIFLLRFHHAHDHLSSRSFFYFVKKLFLNRRKNVLNNLTFLTLNKEKITMILRELSMDGSLRPEQLSFHTILQLFLSFQGHFEL
jgi:16S rRNA (adenine1518-N6/adenine1519-N6)-dimethyltransferase